MQRTAREEHFYWCFQLFCADLAGEDMFFQAQIVHDISARQVDELWASAYRTLADAAASVAHWPLGLAEEGQPHFFGCDL